MPEARVAGLVRVLGAGPGPGRGKAESVDLDSADDLRAISSVRNLGQLTSVYVSC